MIGGAGGTRITTGVAQTVASHIWLKKSIQARQGLKSSMFLIITLLNKGYGREQKDFEFEYMLDRINFLILEIKSIGSMR